MSEWKLSFIPLWFVIKLCRLQSFWIFRIIETYFWYISVQMKAAGSNCNPILFVGPQPELFENWLLVILFRIIAIFETLNLGLIFGHWVCQAKCEIFWKIKKCLPHPRNNADLLFALCVVLRRGTFVTDFVISFVREPTHSDISMVLSLVWNFAFLSISAVGLSIPVKSQLQNSVHMIFKISRYRKMLSSLASLTLNWSGN